MNASMGCYPINAAGDLVTLRFHRKDYECFFRVLSTWTDGREGVGILTFERVKDLRPQ
ncbi:MULTISPECIES: hypothetical protein [Caballeronia]|uniref:Uncharacterized protein n=1 Tax=Caballeronia jiangsuensis TaxID=1458357 RepID=A0ABW9CHR7_9BURK|nr:hypothetical protein [Caballeronia sp. GaOx3]